MFRAPNAPLRSRASTSTSARERTSSLRRCLALRPSSLSSARSVAMTVAPSPIKASAMARPMPWPAAVTSAILPCSLLLMLPLHFLPHALCIIQRRKADFLPAFAVKIFRRQPAFEVGFAPRPFAVDHGEPGGVAIAALYDHMLTKEALEEESIAPGGTARRRVERVAFPFVATIAERLESIARQQVLGFGGERRPLQCRAVENIAD